MIKIHKNNNEIVIIFIRIRIDLRSTFYFLIEIAPSINIKDHRRIRFKRRFILEKHNRRSFRIISNEVINVKIVRQS